MRIVIAPQEFKGTLSSAEAVQAMAEGARSVAPDAELVLVPMADGGPGTVGTVITAAGGETMHATVRDPLGRPVEATWGLLGDDTGIMEMAAAAGLWRLDEDERDAGATSTYGVGELVLAALDAGCRRLIVGLGGSATNDGGAGMAQALGARLLDGEGHNLPPGGAALARLDRIDTAEFHERARKCQVIAASDVTNPLCGPEGASRVYAPQKGADETTALELDAALLHYAQVVRRDVGRAVLNEPSAGAAGGLGAGLIGFLGARVEPGVDVVANVVGLRNRLRGADLVLTGEGTLDGQTGYGKTVAGVARLAAAEAAPALVVAGSVGPGWERVLQMGVDGVEVMVPGTTTPQQALERPAEVLATTTARAVQGWLRMRAITSGGSG